MGGGTPLIEANRLGCDVYGSDINPMAAWIVQEELADLDLAEYRREAASLLAKLTQELGDLYTTRCTIYGDDRVPVKYFLWVKVVDCERCHSEISLFPGYRIADDTRHPFHVLVCSKCGSLAEIKNLARPGRCTECSTALTVEGPARRGICPCPECGHSNRYPRPHIGPPAHRLFALEYYNPHRAGKHKGRFFKRAEPADLARYEQAGSKLHSLNPEFVPTEAIPGGDETNRLLRWGYRSFGDLFNQRQLLGLES
ncbi:MAG TPA: DNA methylase, partial [Candidatus Binatia bacterium]|nr:DNA methylase [Candidatus Binatia bacterium]